MPYYEWSEAMSVGVPLIDSDHKALFRLINRLHDGIETEDEAEVLSQVLDSLIAYVKFHFAREEKVMEACGYPELPGHREEHARFTDRIRKFRDRQIREPDASVMRELLDHLKTALAVRSGIDVKPIEGLDARLQGRTYSLLVIYHEDSTV